MQASIWSHLGLLGAGRQSGQDVVSARDQMHWAWECRKYIISALAGVECLNAKHHILKRLAHQHVPRFSEDRG
jgi:hypothetical protein